MSEKLPIIFISDITVGLHESSCVELRLQSGEAEMRPLVLTPGLALGLAYSLITAQLVDAADEGDAAARLQIIAELEGVLNDTDPAQGMAEDEQFARDTGVMEPIENLEAAFSSKSDEPTKEASEKEAPQAPPETPLPRKRFVFNDTDVAPQVLALLSQIFDLPQTKASEPVTEETLDQALTNVCLTLLDGASALLKTNIEALSKKAEA